MADALLLENFAAYLDGVAKKLASEPMSETMEAAKQAMQAGQAANFAGQHTRDGAAWAPRKPPTGNWPILNKTGALMAAATGQGPGAIQASDGRSATVGVDASVHVPGGGVHAAGFHQSGTSRMPARPYIGASDEIEEAIGQAIADRGLEFFQ